MGLLSLAWRNVWRSPRRSGIVVVAVAVGIAGSLLSMALNFGMVAQMVETAIATELGHVQIHAVGWDEQPELAVRLTPWPGGFESALEASPGVDAWAPRVRAQGLVTSTRASVGVRVSGVDVAREGTVSLLEGSLVEGSWLEGDRRHVLIGRRLAARLQVGLGDKVILSVQDLHGDLVGQPFRVRGLFATPSRDIDANLAVIDIAAAQTLLRLDDAVSEVVIHTEAPVEALRDQLAAQLGPGVEARTWSEAQPLLQFMVETFDTTAWFLYGAVFVATAFGIANVLLMAVVERTREIGVMLSVGMRRRRLVAMIVLESMAVTAMGVGLGCAFALISVAALSEGIDLSAYADGLEEFGAGTTIVPVIRPRDFIPPVAIAVVAAVGASVWPALRAVSLRPAEALRHV